MLARERSGLTRMLAHTFTLFSPHPLTYFTTLRSTQSIKVGAWGRGWGDSPEGASGRKAGALLTQLMWRERPPPVQEHGHTLPHARTHTQACVLDTLQRHTDTSWASGHTQDRHTDAHTQAPKPHSHPASHNRMPLRAGIQRGQCR